MYRATGSNSRMRTWGRLAVTSALLSGTACGTDKLPSRPEFGIVNISVSETGGDIDLDGFEVILDGMQQLTVQTPTGFANFFASPGAHSVELRNVASNCTVSGPNPRPVTIVYGQTASVEFAVVCIATGIVITTRTAGSDIPPQYRVAVDASTPVELPVNGTLTVGRLAAGVHTLALLSPEHCSAASGTGPITVNVVTNQVVPVTFDVTCTTAIRRERIAYVANETGPSLFGNFIEVVNVDGTRRERLHSGDSPSWSRDGLRVLFSDAQCGYYDECWGGLVFIDPEIWTADRLSVGLQAFAPAISPSRPEIAIDRLRSSARNLTLYLLDLVTARETQMVTAGPRSSGQSAWSPDGERLAFVCEWQGSEGNDLCIVNRDGTGLARLTNDPERQGRPAWSPDGRRIAFARYPVSGGALADIVLLDVASSQVTVIGTGYTPAWSPDGTRIVYGGSDGLFIMKADGSSPVRLTTGRHLSPAWRPKL